MNPTDTTQSSSRGLALGVLCAMQLMIVLDGTIVTVALPTIQNELGFTQAGLSWVVNSYLIAFAGLLLLSGRLGDLIGSKKVFLGGLVTFTAASLVCGVANSEGLLIAGRFAQGVGAALASAVVLGMIVGLYPEPGKQAKAMGIYSFVSAGGASVGLIAGGVITESLGWHWVFLVNLPIGVVAFLAGTKLLASTNGLGLRAGADAIGAVLVTGGLSLGVFTISQVAEPSKSSGQLLAYGAVSIVLLAGFVLRQAKASRPLLALRIFRNREISGANIVVILVFAAGFGFQFLNALYLQRVLGFNSMQTGLAFLPAPLVIGTMSLFFSVKLTIRYGTRRVLLTGLAALAVGLVLLSRAPVDGNYWQHVMPTLVIQGFGMGLAVPAVIMRAMSGAAPSDAGLASGLNSTAQQSGAAVGLAVLATVATTRSNSLLSKGAENVSALRDGYSLAFLFSAGFVALGFLATYFILKDAPKPDPEVSPSQDQQDAGESTGHPTRVSGEAVAAK
ncbi:MFS transporter [Streptomyces sp. H10-C2]|uniref:MFS transporter n=1 Tax=unclassified Streptomyces TaxID=2593676 RepID=UPI0024BBCCBB|nr:MULTISPECIES: MFS transporter [unclassified Streptomyces]MDJ0346857.1 MFS transporter [Streptomyces sp. PH10-H1]MDJ0372862.1 MFS transporter [Streptomyces sp. H10-C2]